ncbi:MAG: isoprenoid biosynthesis glyoxalase ElbB [Bacteroidetes bacterium]|nr:isoprenoid biosynthesis glyoxalase ElbB [Bacteroidota bacterium]
MKKFAVVLSGCGVYDGAEIHEAVLTLLAIDKAGAVYQCFAPDIPQHHVVNHVTGKEMSETRNVMVESARIARGNIKPLSQFRAVEYDAIIFPGGFGAAKNLCDWAIKGDNCTVNPEVEHAIKSMFEAGKPIGAMCISPVIFAKLFRGTNLTTGNDPASGKFIEKAGNKYTQTGHGEVVIDPVRKIFTTPCYMLDATISQIAEGTENVVREILTFVNH